MSQPHSGIAAPALGPLTWRKSSASNSNGACVELADLHPGHVAIRDSKHPHGPALVFTRGAITALIAGIRAGDFDQT